MKVKLVSAVRKWTVILNSAGGMRDCCVVRESGGHTFCLSPRDFCRGLNGHSKPLKDNGVYMVIVPQACCLWLRTVD